MPTRKRLLEPSWECFQPLQTLKFDEKAPLMCRCLGLWKYWAHPNHLGPMMACSDLNRAILIDSGLPIEDTARLTKRFQAGNNSERWITLTRLLITMGCHIQARDVLHRIPYSSTPNLNAWNYYLGWQLENARGPKIGNEEQIWDAIQTIKPPYGPGVILVSLIILRKCKAHYANVKKFLIKVINLSILDPWEKRLALARLYRLDSELHELANKSKNALELLDISFLTLNKANESATAHWQQQLCLETKRRILEYAFRLSLRQSDKISALNFAEQMVQIDPQCSRAHLLAGEVSLSMNRLDEAKRYLHQASILGVIEKPYANYLLIKCSSSQLKEYYTSKAIQSAFFRKDAPQLMLSDPFPSSMDISDLICNAYIEKPQANLKQRFLDDTLLNRFIAYWLPGHVSTQKAPMCAILPQIAWKIFESCPEPYFTTHGVQRALVPGFRRELLHASNGWRWVADEQFTKLSSWCSVMKDAEKISDAACNTLGKPLEQAYFARYLAMMGFFSEASEFLRAYVKSENFKSLEEQFLVTVHLWISHFFVTTDCKDFLFQLFSHYENLSNCSETLRMRCTISILGTVISAKTRRIQDCEFWRTQAIATLNLIQECPRFSSGDKMLLESRIYRAVCYMPFIAGQNDQLLQEQEHFLKYAYDLSSHFTEENEIIFRDNLFAALESSARIVEKVKGPNHALSYMKEIIEKVDPLDSKAWLQVGELYQKLKMFPEALNAFIQAATIGAPHMQISYYSAGRCAEQLNDLVLAKELFLQSALALPGGISPLLRLIKVCESVNDQQLKQWAISNMNSLTL